MGFSKSGRCGRLLGHSRGRRLASLLGVVAAVGAIASLPATAGAAIVYYPPTATPAVQTATGFELKGNVYDYGGTTTYHFEYGTTTAYGTSVPAPDAEASTNLSSSVSEQISGLMPGTTYHWCLVSTNSVEGTGFSADQTFTTAGAGTAPTTPTMPMAPTAPTTSPPATVGGSGPKRVVKTRSVKGRTLLTTTAGRTLYTLSVEKHGKFVCTAEGGCTGIWHPLTVAAGVMPQGPVKLGTVSRPEGTVQVTYRGLPLYTFASDKKAGQVKGEGLKDVGVWHATTVSAPKPSP
jgi:predicted lipoprotein with Yx(FWY)xxD motif